MPNENELRDAVKLCKEGQEATREEFENTPDFKAVNLLVTLAESYLAASGELPKKKMVIESNKSPHPDTLNDCEVRREGFNDAHEQFTLAVMKGWVRKDSLPSEEAINIEIATTPILISEVTTKYMSCGNGEYITLLALLGFDNICRLAAAISKRIRGEA